MPSYKFSEIPMPSEYFDNLSEEDGLWGGYMPVSLSFDKVSAVANEILTERQYEVFIMLSKGMSQEEISSKLGICQSMVSKHFSLLRKKIKKYFDENGDIFG